MDFQLSEEQREFRHVVHEFVAKEVKPMARHTDETGEFNWTAVHKMGPLGLLGLEVPEAYGGAAVDAISAAIAIEELAWGCGSTALAVSAHKDWPWDRLCAMAQKPKNKPGCPIWQPAKANWPACHSPNRVRGRICRAGCAQRPLKKAIPGSSTAAKCG